MSNPCESGAILKCNCPWFSVFQGLSTGNHKIHLTKMLFVKISCQSYFCMWCWHAQFQLKCIINTKFSVQHRIYQTLKEIYQKTLRQMRLDHHQTLPWQQIDQSRSWLLRWIIRWVHWLVVCQKRWYCVNPISHCIGRFAPNGNFFDNFVQQNDVSSWYH